MIFLILLFHPYWLPLEQPLGQLTKIQKNSLRPELSAWVEITDPTSKAQPRTHDTPYAMTTISTESGPWQKILSPHGYEGIPNLGGVANQPSNRGPPSQPSLENGRFIAPNKIALGEQPRDAWGKFMSKTNPGQRTPGLSAVDDFAEQAGLNGFLVRGKEVSVQTPFGLRRYDVVIEELSTGRITGVEIKSSRSAFRRFEAQQEAADKWLKMQDGLQAVGEYKLLKIDDTIKILWEAP